MKSFTFPQLVILLSIAIGAYSWPNGLVWAEDAEDVVRGAYLTAAAGCETCHTDNVKGAVPFAGRRPLKTPFGVFFTPNITPDKTHGIGGWGSASFLKALKQGLNPEGDHYFPAFPYTSYAKMTDADALMIFAYLKSLPASSVRNKEHDISAPFSWRWLQRGWKMLFFDPMLNPTVDKSSPQVNRGHYLVEALGHCSECHTHRNVVGGLDPSQYLAGSVTGGEGELTANITPDAATGIGDWSEDDLVSFLQSGMKPDFDSVQGSMEEVISHGTSKLTKADRLAIAQYLQHIPAIVKKIEKSK